MKNNFPVNKLKAGDIISFPSDKYGTRLIQLIQPNPSMLTWEAYDINNLEFTTLKVSHLHFVDYVVE